MCPPLWDRYLQCMAPTIVVLVANPRLRDALATALRSSGLVRCYTRLNEAPSDWSGVVTVVTTADCGPEQCASFSALGASVIVLSALSRPRDRQLYLDAGAAAFLSMPVPFHQLLSVVTAAAPIPAFAEPPVPARTDRR